MSAVCNDLLQTEIGCLILGVDGQGRVCFIGFTDGDYAAGDLTTWGPADMDSAAGDPRYPVAMGPDAAAEGLHKSRGQCAALKKQLTEYFNGQRRNFDFAPVIAGTEFQRQVLQAVAAVPYGEVISYAELARRVGRPQAVRAVGNALGANKTAILVPCHRVVRGSGKNGGYRWGDHRKTFLLALERGR